MCTLFVLHPHTFYVAYTHSLCCMHTLFMLHTHTLMHSHTLSLHAHTPLSVQWQEEDNFENPGPIQFEGPTADVYNRTLYEEQFEYMAMMEQLHSLTSYISGICSFGVDKETLKIAVVSLQGLGDIIADK